MKAKRISKATLTLLLFIYTIYSFAQQNEIRKADSLINLIEKNKRKNSDSVLLWGYQLLKIAKQHQNHKLKYEAGRKISYFYLKNRLFDSVRKYDQLMLKSAKQLDSFKIISSYQNMGAYYDAIAKKDSALILLKKGQKVGYNNLKSDTKEDSIKKLKSILFIETAIVKSYFRNKEFEKALDLTYSNLNTSNKYDITTFHAWNYFYLGLINLELGNYEDAEKYYLKELNYSKEQKNPNMIGFSLIHLGNVYIKQNKNNEALELFINADKIFKKNNYIKGMLASKRRLYEVNDKIGNYNDAIKIGESYIKEYLKGKKQDEYLSILYMSLGKTYNKIGNKSKGIEYINKGIKYVDKDFGKDNISIMNEAYLAYKEIQNYKTSLFYFEIVTKLKDSLLLNENFTNQLAEANKKFEVEEKNNKILTQELELERKRKEKRLLIYISSVIALLTLFLGYLLYKRKKELKLEHSKYLQESERGKRLREMTLRLQNAPKKIDGLDDPDFLNFVMQKTKINQDLLDVYVGLVKGKTYQEIAESVNLGLSGTKTRINKLYESLKIYSKTDLDTKITKSQCVKIFNDSYVDYQIVR